MRQFSPYPLRFEAVNRPKIWGCERWLVSSHPSCPSVISNGPLKGRALNEVYPGFFLLIKEIIPESWLSVQVHPDEKTCKAVGGEPKTEMWRVLSTGTIIAGVKKGIAKGDVEDFLAKGKVAECLNYVDVNQGDIITIQAGLIHALGPGVRVFEIQQCSDTTFRLYDWDRIDERGERRALQIEEAFIALDFNKQVSIGRKESKALNFTFVEEDYVGVTQIETENNFLVIYCAFGDMLVEGESLSAGDVILLPPKMCAIIKAKEAKAFIARISNNG